MPWYLHPEINEIASSIFGAEFLRKFGGRNDSKSKGEWTSARILYFWIYWFTNVCLDWFTNYGGARAIDRYDPLQKNLETEEGKGGRSPRAANFQKTPTFNFVRRPQIWEKNTYTWGVCGGRGGNYYPMGAACWRLAPGGKFLASHCKDNLPTGMAPCKVDPPKCSLTRPPFHSLVCARGRSNRLEIWRLGPCMG